MAQNHIAEGEVWDVPISATVASGSGIKVGSVIGVALGSGVNGDTIRVAVSGVWELPKASGAITQGAPLYWDDTNKRLTTTATDNTLAGYAYAAAVSGATVVRCKLFLS